MVRRLRVSASELSAPESTFTFRSFNVSNEADMLLVARITAQRTVKDIANEWNVAGIVSITTKAAGRNEVTRQARRIERGKRTTMRKKSLRLTYEIGGDLQLLKHTP